MNLSTGTNPDANSARVIVPGVRRVWGWGVLKFSPGAVISTIQKIAIQDFGDKLTIHRSSEREEGVIEIGGGFCYREMK